VPMHSIPLPTGDDPITEINPSARDIWDISAQISTREDVETQIPIISADEWLRRGDFELPRQVVADYGDRYFISTILDTPYSDMYDYLGFRGLMVIQRRNPDLLQYLLERRLMQSKEVMEAWAAIGMHGVYVEEVFSAADTISPQSYERFVYAYNQPYFQHMRSMGLLPIHYVCGDVIPRLEYIVQYDIAAVAVEESKKKFRIELAEVVERVAGRTAVFGNIDAVRFGIHATPEEMSAEVERQAGIGAQAGGFIVSTGSPFPLETNPRMVDTLVTAAHSFTN
jgi:uroporphyrinogen-III decarboxylase